MLEIGELLSPLIAKGHSLNHILATHKDEIGLSEKTIYNYIDANVFSVKNIDLGENEKKLLDLLDLAPIATDEVCLKPALLKRKPN